MNDKKIYFSYGEWRQLIMEGKEYNDWKNFGIRVKNSRNSVGMTVEKLAEKSNRTENFIFRIEAGQSCSIHTLYQLSKALNKSSDHLLFGKDMKTEEINYSDREIIDNILKQCDEKQLKIVKEVLIAICPNFNDLLKK